MHSFGVCYYDFEAYEPKVENLVKFSSYDEAYNYYTHKTLVYTGGYPDKTFWLVWIENNKIIQFERFGLITKCKQVDLEEP